MSAKKWKLGSVVRLRSGGPKMTVSSMPEDLSECVQYTLRCVWFDGNDEFHDEVFDSESLEQSSP